MLFIILAYAPVENNNNYIRQLGLEQIKLIQTLNKVEQI